MWKLLVILVFIKCNVLGLVSDKYRIKVSDKYRILEYFNQALYLIEGIIRVLCPRRVLGCHRFLGLYRFLGPHKVVDSYRAFSLGSSQSPGPRFSVI